MASSSGPSKTEGDAAQDVDSEEESSGYHVGEKVALEEILKRDEEDESLRRYKASLLGAAAEGQTIVDPSNPNVVIFDKFVVELEGRDPLIFPLNSAEALLSLQKTKFRIKQGTKFVFRVTFFVQRDIVSGLAYENRVFKHGIRVDRTRQMFGSLGPRTEPYTFVCYEDEAPTGFFARGSYKAKTAFVDDDKATHLEFSYKFQIAKNWE